MVHYMKLEVNSNMSASQLEAKWPEMLTKCLLLFWTELFEVLVVKYHYATLCKKKCELTTLHISQMRELTKPYTPYIFAVKTRVGYRVNRARFILTNCSWVLSSEHAILCTDCAIMPRPVTSPVRKF